MGTWLALEAVAADEKRALAGIERAYRTALQLEHQLHPSREDSDLRRICTARPGTAVSIGLPTWEVLRLAQSVYALSDGIFDPCLPGQPGRLCDLRLSDHGVESPWALCRAPLALDLGGIAKGYAIDRAIETLRAAGCASGVVNAGGDVRVFGRSETVLLRESDGNCLPFRVNDEALAVSDLDAQAVRRPVEHCGYYRRSGEFRPVHRYAAVVAASAAIADAATKCVLLAAAPCAKRTLRALGARHVR